MSKHFACDCKKKFNCTTYNSNHKWNKKTCQCKCKNYRTCKKDYSWNPSTCTCENSKYLKSIADINNCVWWYYICYGYCINKNFKSYSIKYATKLSKWKSKIENWLLYFAYSFISDHITTDNCYSFLALCKA